MFLLFFRPGEAPEVSRKGFLWNVRHIARQQGWGFVMINHVMVDMAASGSFCALVAAQFLAAVFGHAYRNGI